MKPLHIPPAVFDSVAKVHDRTKRCVSAHVTLLFKQVSNHSTSSIFTRIRFAGLPSNFRVQSSMQTPPAIFDGKVFVVSGAVVPMFHSRVQAPHEMIPKMSRCENPKGNERVSKLPQQGP